MWNGIKTILQLIWFLTTKWAERNSEKKKAKKEIMDDYKRGLKDNDISRVNAAIDRMHRL